MLWFYLVFLAPCMVAQTWTPIQAKYKRVSYRVDADGKTIVIPRDDVDGTKPGLSSMPDDLVKQLTLRELRDLIEYLANQKTPVTAAPSTAHEFP